MGGVFTASGATKPNGVFLSWGLIHYPLLKIGPEIVYGVAEVSPDVPGFAFFTAPTQKGVLERPSEVVMRVVAPALANDGQ